MAAPSDEGNVGGYSVAYKRDDTYFPVYITAALAAIFVTAGWIMGVAYWLVPAVAAAAFAALRGQALTRSSSRVGVRDDRVPVHHLGPLGRQ